MKKFRRWAFVALCVLLGMEILTIAPKKLGKQEEKKVKQEKKYSSITTTSQAMRGVKLVETTPDGKEWELEADYAQEYKDKGSWKMQGVTVRYYGSGGITYVVTGDSGTIEVDSKNMEIYGNVNMETSDGYVMKSQSLFFESKKRVLSTQDFIAVVGPKAQGVFELTGKGFRSDLKTNMMNLLDDVKAVRSIGTGREMNIKSDKAKISGAEKYAQFDQRVQVDIEAVRMTGESAHFVYSDEQKALKEMAMNGNVHVTDQTHFASSEQAQVLFDKEEFILKGNPRVVQNDNELRGEEIHLLDGGKSVKVLRARAKVDAEGGPSL